MADYLKYQQRKLREQLATSPYNQLRQEIGQVGRETQRIAKQTDATLKRQNVPLGARIEGARQLQTDYAQNIGSAFERVSVQDQQRKQDIMRELDAVNVQLAEQEKAEGKGLLNTGIQVASTVIGAGVGLMAVNPLLGAQIGAQYGASAGQAISGVAGIASGDASEQDWANVGQGIISGVSLGVEQANLNSIKAENTESMAEMTRIWNDDTIPDATKQWMFQQMELGLGQGMSMGEITEAWSGINRGNQVTRGQTSMGNQATGTSPNLNVSESSANRYEASKNGMVIDTLTGETFDATEMNRHGLSFEQQQYIIGSKNNPYSNQ